MLRMTVRKTASCSVFPAGSLSQSPSIASSRLNCACRRLEMQFQERGKPVPHLLNPEEHSPAETEAWILVELLHRGIERDKFSKSLPYVIDNLMSGDAEDYAPEACVGGLELLNAWFCAAASILSPDGRVACRPESLTIDALRRWTRPGFRRAMSSTTSHIFLRELAATAAVSPRHNWRMRKIPTAAAAEFIGHAPAVRRA